MTELDFRNFRRLAVMVPVISAVALVLIQWGAWQANSANIQKQFTDQKTECEKRFEKMDREKANADVIETKFNNIDWKLNLIMKNLGVIYVERRDTL